MERRFLVFCAGIMLSVGVALSGAQAAAQSTSPDNSQAGPPQGEHMRGRMSPEMQLEHMSKMLNLTDDQKSQIKPILENRMQKMHELRTDSSLSREEMRSKARSLMEDSNVKIRALLTDEQKPKFDQMQQRMHERTHSREGGSNSPSSSPNS